MQNTSRFKNITAINKGVGEQVGSSNFNSNASAPTNYLLNTHKNAGTVWRPGLLDTAETITVELTTLDSVVESYGILKIDILKLDVQGAEFRVIKGAK